MVLQGVGSAAPPLLLDSALSGSGWVCVKSLFSHSVKRKGWITVCLHWNRCTFDCCIYFTCRCKSLGKTSSVFISVRVCVVTLIQLSAPMVGGGLDMKVLVLVWIQVPWFGCWNTNSLFQDKDCIQIATVWLLAVDLLCAHLNDSGSFYIRQAFFHWSDLRTIKSNGKAWFKITWANIYLTVNVYWRRQHSLGQLSWIQPSWFGVRAQAGLELWLQVHVQGGCTVEEDCMR